MRAFLFALNLRALLYDMGVLLPDAFSLHAHSAGHRDAPIISPFLGTVPRNVTEVRVLENGL